MSKKNSRRIERLEERQYCIEAELEELRYNNKKLSQSPVYTDYSRLLIRNKDPGVFVGLPYDDSGGSYVGIPQGHDGHIAVIGGSGVGKSLCLANPTLKTFEGSICTIDIKGELSEHYAHLYAKGLVANSYIVFDPENPQSPAFDVFGWVRTDSERNALTNIEEIAKSIIPDLRFDADKFWTDCERSVLSAALFYFYDLGLGFSEAVCMILSTSISELCKKLTASNNSSVQMLIGDIGVLEPKQLASISRGIRNSLSIFATDPCIGHAFRGKSEGAVCFTWENLEEYNVFLRIPEERIESWSGPIRIMLTQLLQHLMRRPDKYSSEGKNSVPALLLFDEVSRLGKIDLLPLAISTLRSKQVTMCLMIQSMAQLDKHYGPDDRKIILDNCAYKAVLRANDPDTQSYLSKMIGTERKMRYSCSESHDDCGDLRSYSNQRSESMEYVIQPHELASMEDVIFITPLGVKILRKFLVFDLSHPLYTSTKYDDVIRCDAVLAEKFDDTTAVVHVTARAKNTTDPNKFKIKEEIRMLTVNERVQNANRRAEIAERNRKINDRRNSELAQKAESKRYFEVGKLVVQYFPELLTLDVGINQEEAAKIYTPLEKFLQALSADREYMQRLAEKSGLNVQIPSGI